MPSAKPLFVAGIAAAAACLALPAAATAQTSPSVAAANQDVQRAVAGRQAVTAAVNAESQAQYDADRAAYRRALMRHDHAAMRDTVRYDHQQRAYADAMREWRHQTYACHHGSMRACHAPTPDPAAYW